MSNRYLAWTLLIAACGLQAYLLAKGASYFGDLETVMFPRWFIGFSSYLGRHNAYLPFFISLFTATFALPFMLTILAWVLMGLRRKSGQTLSLIVDLFFALPSLALISINLAQNLRFHHLGIQNNPEVLLFALASLHIFFLYSPPIRTLTSSRPALRDVDNDVALHIASAR